MGKEQSDKRGEGEMEQAFAKWTRTLSADEYFGYNAFKAGALWQTTLSHAREKLDLTDTRNIFERNNAPSTTPQKTLATHITDESLERINDLHKIVRDNARSDYHDAMEKFQNLVGVMWENIYSRCAGTTASATRRTNNQALEAPMPVLEWIWHMDLHLTEHDEPHAGRALRAAWPHVREYMVKLGEELGAKSVGVKAKEYAGHGLTPEMVKGHYPQTQHQPDECQICAEVFEVAAEALAMCRADGGVHRG